MKQLLYKFSRRQLLVGLTLVAILLANALNYCISIYFVGEFTWIDLLRSTLIPLVLVPVLAWNLISRAFKLARVERELKKIVTYDGLTKLYTRNAFLELATKSHKEAINNQTPLSVLALDLDLFKSINDKYGHDTGDYALLKFGELVLSLADDKYICGRLGGEEFAIVLPQTNHDTAKKFAEYLREKLKNSILIYKTNEILLTTSIGISCLDLKQPQNFDELLVEADRALYLAKRTGRNKSVTYDAEKILKQNQQSSS
ncbi:MAG: GGDEF domain-containing protein [Gammaproteobacteria bacterium]|nr:GGDEF domain-containing protein [Gammaproteobacteria bacterium]